MGLIRVNRIIRISLFATDAKWIDNITFATEVIADVDRTEHKTTVYLDEDKIRECAECSDWPGYIVATCLDSKPLLVVPPKAPKSVAHHKVVFICDPRNQLNVNKLLHGTPNTTEVVFPSSMHTAWEKYDGYKLLIDVPPQYTVSTCATYADALAAFVDKPADISGTYFQTYIEAFQKAQKQAVYYTDNGEKLCKIV